MKEWLIRKKSRIIIAGVLMTALPLVTLALAIYFALSATIEGMVIEENRALANIAEKRIEAGLSNALRIGDIFSARPLLIRAIRNNDRKTMAWHLKDLLDRYDSIDNAFIATTKGVLIANYPSDPAVLDRDFSHRDWYKGVSRDWAPYVSDFYTRAIKPTRNVFAITVPIKDERGAIIGIMGMQPKDDFIQKLLGPVRIGKGTVYIVDKNATLIYHSAFKLEGLLNYSYDPVVKMALLGAEGGRKLTDPADGVKNIYAFRQIEMVGWVVVVKQKYSDVMMPLTQLTFMLFIFTTFMIALGGYLSYKAALQFFEITQLSDALKEEEAVEKAANEVLTLFSKVWTDEAESGSALLNKLQELGCMEAGVKFILENGAVVPRAALTVPMPAMADGLTLDCIKHKTTMIVSDVPQDSYMAVETVTAGKIMPKEIMALPLVIKGEVIGALEIASISGFSDRSRKIIAHILPHIANSLNSISDHKKVREMADQVAVSNEELRVTNEELQVVNEEIQAQQQELNEANRRLTDASKAKSDFLANMSHELRTPLNSIIGFSEIMYDQIPGQLNPDQLEYTGIIMSSGRHLLSLIDDILDLAKIESGKEELSISRILLRGMLADALNLFREKAQKHSIRLTMTEDIPDDLFVEADSRKMKQILYNLLSNALKFTQEGGSVTLSAVCVKNQDAIKRFPELSGLNIDFVEITVTDTGIGIQQEDIPKLFKEFIQIESPYEKKYQGTGLGLALSKQLVEKHGGKLWVESEFGKGSRFAFIFPQTCYPEQAQPVNRGYKSEYKGTRGAALVIEDDIKSAAIISEALNNRGYSVITAADGQTGLRAALAKLPDLIILDMILPGMNGSEVLAQLKEHEATSKIPVIILTSMDLSQSERRAFGSQVREILEKGQIASNAFLDLVDKVYLESTQKHGENNET
jgi:signal transduction histidine kinase/CheY-like chemotaxis protein